MKKIRMENVALIAFLAACLSGLGFAEHMLRQPAGLCVGIWYWIRSDNLHFYLVMLMVTAAAFGGVRIVSIFLHPSYETSQADLSWSIRKQRFVVAAIVISILAIFGEWLTIELQKEFAVDLGGLFYKVPVGIYFTLFAIGNICIFCIVKKKKDISRTVLEITCFFCLTLAFFSLYYVNIFKVDMYHKIAVLESIYNVCDLVPIDSNTAGIYGHYSIFFLLPMRLTHGSLYIAVGLMAFFYCVALGATFYILDAWLPTNWLKAVMACACVITTTITSGPYWQLHPIRDVFPMLLCAYICFIVKRRETAWHKKYILIGYALVSMAILWNTETGIFCAVAFSASVIVMRLQSHIWYEKYMLLEYVKVVFYSLVSLLLSIGIVNIYNLCCGGKLIFKDFFYPLLTESYMIDVLRYDMPLGNHAWLYVFVLFMLVLTWGVYHTSLFQKEKSVCEEAPVAVAIAIMGLLVFSYYVNRAASMNLSICYLEALCANALLIKVTWASLYEWKEKTSFKEIGRKVIAITCIVVITCLAALIPLGVVKRGKVWTDMPDLLTTRGIEEDLLPVAAEVPENAYGFGSGISVLYHMLDWDNYAHTRDTPDFMLEGWEELSDEIAEEMAKQNGLFVGSEQQDEMIMGKVLAIQPFTKRAAYTIQGKEYYHYEQDIKEGKSFNDGME